MGTEKTKSYPIRMPEEVMVRLRESAALANLRQGDFLDAMLIMYERHLRWAYEIASIDFKNRCKELDNELLKTFITDRDVSSKEIKMIGDTFKTQLAEKYKKFFGENK